jgi:carbamoyltransferase
MTSRITIGIHDGHNASAAVIRDGKIELALQEERLTRRKNQGDAPAEVLQQVVFREIAGAPARVALNGLYVNYGQWERETIENDYDRSAGWKQPLKGTFIDRAYRKHKAALREERLKDLGVEAMEPVEHHTAHASAAYFTSPSKDVLVFTCDGSGDRIAATVSIGDKRIAEVSEHDSIGRLYALVTRYLGMSPLEHEYKVMGLAPYAGGGERVQRMAQVFLDLFEFHGLAWRRRKGVPSMYGSRDFLAGLVSGARFDVIAAGAQMFIEQMLSQWVRNAIRETGIRKIACSGGVFMNVKANLALLELSEVETMYVFPSCGDESNSIGAACYVAARSGERIQPLSAIYYGDPITDEEVEQALRSARGIKARFCSDIESVTAENLAEGKIVARAKGPVEFGARALGNRSILARADSPTAVRTINQMIKNRDFWMPFAPSVLAERAGDYYSKPKPVSSPYMMFAFPSRPEKRAAFSAAMHAWDFTTRPHEVEESHNPAYHRLLKEYEARTGEGIVLNTSFNLHGDPIVYRATDALSVFERSGLDRMALGNWWVEKI